MQRVETLNENNQIIVMGLSHHHAPLTMLERAHFNEQKLALALRDLQNRPGVMSGIILSTCNRTEVIALGASPQLRIGCEQFFAHWCGDEIKENLRIYENLDAITHVFSVAASIDSMVPGEAQILGQLKDAYKLCLELKRVHPMFDLLMRRSFSVAKRVRSETGIAAQAVSIAYAAVELARKIFTDLSKSKVMLIGAGEMAELAARHLLKRGIEELIICNRSYQRATNLAGELSATAIPFDKLQTYLGNVDMVIASTAAEHYLLDKSTAKQLMRQRLNRPLFIIDIALPRNIAPDVNDIDNVYLYNLADLKNVVEANMSARQQEVQKALTIVNAESQQLYSKLSRQHFNTLLANLDQSIRSVVETEVNRLLSRCAANMSQSVKDEIIKIIPSITSKLMHHPSRYLREQADNQSAEILHKALLPTPNADEVAQESCEENSNKI